MTKCLFEQDHKVPFTQKNVQDWRQQPKVRKSHKTCLITKEIGHEDKNDHLQRYLNEHLLT